MGNFFQVHWLVQSDFIQSPEAWGEVKNFFQLPESRGLLFFFILRLYSGINVPILLLKLSPFKKPSAEKSLPLKCAEITVSRPLNVPKSKVVAP